MNKFTEDCKICKHLYVTYKPNFPWGCRAFGFISKNYPYSLVYKTSGMKCALFLKNNKKKIINNEEKDKNKGRLA
tara:strand:+ start:529 stop:753 length:225 start_codon:yes stop_codon:yes gene_type:complete